MNIKLCFLSFLYTFISFSQNDCTDAIVVCGNSGYNDLNATGSGVQELNSNTTCDGQENNSIWLKLNIKSGGTLAFTLTPASNDINEDFDFYIFGPNATCDNLNTTIRCSTTNPKAAEQSNNLTGLKDSENDTYEGPGYNGNSFLKPLDVKAGESYFLVIDRPIGTSNFRLDWTGTAKFYDSPIIDSTNLVKKTMNLEQCGSIDENTTTFDLTQNNGIIGGQENVVLSYHTNNNDAILGENPINENAPYINKSNPETLFVRLTNTTTECFSIDSFKLIVNDLVANKPSDYIVCDDSSSGSDYDGIFNSFLLNSKDTEILKNRDSSQFSISYHISKSDAEQNINSIDKTIHYTNQQINNQKIFFRIENKKTNCYDINSFKLIVQKKTKINTEVILEQCDNDTDGITIFNLKEAEMLISEDYENLSFTYYTSKQGAKDQEKQQEITNFENYRNTNTTESVWFIAESTNGCHKVGELKLKVSTTQIPNNFLITYQECDSPNIDGEYVGISNFNFSDAILKFKELFPPTQQLNINFYTNETDALLEQNEITTIENYTNTTPNTQFLYVRIDSKDNNACIGLGQHIKLQVNPPPSFTIENPKDFCKGDTTTLNAVSKGNYNYEWTKENATTVLSNSNSLTIDSGGTYHVKAINTVTSCSVSKNVFVKELTTATINENDIVITENGELFNIEIINNSNNDNFKDFEFALKTLNGNIISNFQKNTFFNNLTGGEYQLITRNQCGTAIFSFVLIQIPKFFTPNGDGLNDKWIILGVNPSYFPKGFISIYDRYGRIISKYNLEKNEWNGIYNNHKMPTGDYWYTVNLINIKNKRITKIGHFTLIR